MMVRVIFGALIGFFALMPGKAAAVDCTPNCDFVHDYGPYDFTYARPGLYGWPRCGPSGECNPYLVYTWQRPRVVIRPRARIRR